MTFKIGAKVEVTKSKCGNEGLQGVIIKDLGKPTDLYEYEGAFWKPATDHVGQQTWAVEFDGAMFNANYSNGEKKEKIHIARPFAQCDLKVIE